MNFEYEIKNMGQKIKRKEKKHVNRGFDLNIELEIGAVESIVCGYV